MASSSTDSDTAPLLTNSPQRYSSIEDASEPSRGENVESAMGKDEEGGDGENEKFRPLTLPARSKVTLVLCAVANLFSNAGFALPAPFYPQEAEKKGISPSMVGVIFAIFQFVIFIASPILGNYLTRIGAKFMFVAGIFVGGTCSILFGLLYMCPPGTPFLVTSLCCRAIEALGLAAFLTSSFAIVTNEFPKHVGTVFGILETFSGVGLMIGPALGGALYQAGGFGLPFYVVGSVVILNGLLILCTFPAPKDPVTKRKVSIFRLFWNPLIWVTLLNIIVMAIGISFFDPTLADHLHLFSLSTLSIGLIFMTMPALYAVTSPLWGYLSDTKSLESQLIVLGTAVCGLGYFLVGPSPWFHFLPFKLWIVIFGGCLIGLCFGCTVVPTLKCLVSGAMEVGFEDNLDTYGVISGLFSTAFCFGAFMGPLLGGVLIDNIGFNEGTTVIGVVHWATIYFILFLSFGTTNNDWWERFQTKE